ATDSQSATPTGTELWVTDGTSAGTRLVLDLNPGPGDGIPRADGTIVAFGAGVLFAGTTPALGTELWSSDGTASGTRLVADISPASSDPFPLFAFGSIVLFRADDSVVGAELWRSDGTAAGTTLVRDINPLPGPGSSPELFADLGGGKVVFRATGWN